MTNYEKVQKVSNRLAMVIPNFSAIGIFEYGSSVYGYKAADDLDLIVVSEGSFGKQQISYPDINVDVTVYDQATFEVMVQQHEISVLECLFLPKKHIHAMHPAMERIINNFKVDKATLRSSISKKSSNSYVKAKKKIIVAADFCVETSIKSMFHSLRIYQFGNQLATTGKITNYRESNGFYMEIIKKYMDSNVNWDDIHETYKPLHNELASAFKLNAPKEAENATKESTK